LIELESQLGGLTRDHIDYCAGTSTGALIAAAVAAGLPATEILGVYTKRSKEIFTPTGVIAEAKRIAEGYMYDPKHLEKVLVSEFGAAASWVMNDCPIGVMIAATAMNGHNWFFVKDTPKNCKTTGGVKLIDAAVASACAPTYFNYWTIAGIEGKTMQFFDGGTGGTANPAYQACVEAYVYDAYDPADTKVISLGTGFYPQSDKPPKGIVGTIGWATSTLVDTSGDWVDDAVNLKWPGVMTTINPELPSDISEDDIGAISTLVQVGQELAGTMDWKQLLGL
jgi:hypothetical protein